ncbi:MAG: Para-aminobenzoate synthase, aminase component [uncultured Corynebacteriales bacterium]|uniref:aminodeoxychorismate synthase n=1 Tax=uncultured Mycobacteriales bacterium TaxID=581187 RepID=A0A6J4H936_9ACTN|nr:MAG: Para-aminobenzoate synthase, aminase component [uncultured Corynebacteriales bacterium]
MTGPRVAIVDNHDSYTWNLQQLCWELTGREPVVVRNDETTADDLLAGGFTHFVVSPGPGTPHEPADVGVSAELIRRARVPLLGVCLGHQGIAAAFGSRVEPAGTVMHGRRSRIRHTGTGLFAGLPQDFPAVRYHSLVVPRPLHPELVETARADDGVVMGLSHRDRPLHGVQFHPESIGTPAGERLLANFLGPGPRRRPRLPAARPVPARSLRVRWRRLRAVPAEQLFWTLHRTDPYAFWLDSARQAHGLGRHSFLGTGTPATPTRDTARVERDGYGLPFAGGWVGHLEYEGAVRALWVDRFVAVDHATGDVLAVTLGLPPAAAAAWLDGVAAVADALPAGWEPPPVDAGLTDVRPEVDRETYGAHFAEVQGWLRRGESYEACYTYRITARSTADPLAAYLRLRRENPAPYGAYLRFGDRHVLSSSPERFLTVDADGWAETRPIKGTAARDPLRDEEDRAALAGDEKNRSENLMIVDLLRNDLGRVCLPGTVRVPSLMAVESYATVHHLVSTVRGRLRPELHVLDCVAALFPGGSMTGAPKERTVELLAGLETSPRGVYSGCLGWLGPDGTTDLSIVIRTAVRDGDRVTIGVGGAITVLSDVDEEWAETRVKAAAVLHALDPVGAPPVG